MVAFEGFSHPVGITGMKHLRAGRSPEQDILLSGSKEICYLTLNYNMADRAPINYSYSSSGSTIELMDLASTRPSSQPSSRISSRSSPSWHPKLTLYRLVILSTMCLAVEDCCILSQPYLCFHNSGVDSGSGILIVSFGDSKFLDFQ